MTPLFLDPGLLRKRVSLQAADLVSDGSGGTVPNWREVAEVSVRVEPVSVQAAERFERREATITHRVICRARDDVDRGMSFVLGNRRLVVVSVHDPDESRRYLVCRCQEEV
ncbi:phage head closure protein [Aureimonas leprariae]|uniref:Phage head closure protein n=1 Tax=Plantimonas leprariae TaxID=2615207 RepID=A0A7V7TWL3_9HYPH|nr:phage head closure protein [Aureimonas leprariae]KAB0679950.1 phage head closure protein [Aureimonas leprariae]